MKYPMKQTINPIVAIATLTEIMIAARLMKEPYKEVVVVIQYINMHYLHAHTCIHIYLLIH